MKKVLIFDIEIIPVSFGDAWQTMSADPDRSTICSMAYGYEDKKKNHVVALDEWKKDFLKNPYNEEKLVKKIHKIMSDADYLVAHYGDKFDVKYLRTKFGIYGLDMQVLNIPTRDTCLMARRQFKLHSNRLGALAKIFGCQPKMDIGQATWFEVIRGRIGALQKMKKYNVQDVQTLRQVYQHMKPIFPQGKWYHAGVDRYNSRDACAECGYQYPYKDGIRVDRVGRKQRYKCPECGLHWTDTRIIKT